MHGNKKGRGQGEVGGYHPLHLVAVVLVGYILVADFFASLEIVICTL